jgi:hypothetical protein
VLHKNRLLKHTPEHSLFLSPSVRFSFHLDLPVAGSLSQSLSLNVPFSEFLPWTTLYPAYYSALLCLSTSWKNLFADLPIYLFLPTKAPSKGSMKRGTFIYMFIAESQLLRELAHSTFSRNMCQMSE